MGKEEEFSFEEIVKQNERRVHYYIHQLGVRDPHREFYQEGLVAMWHAYGKHEPDKGPLATYFNFTIRNRLIDLIRKQTRKQKGDAQVLRQEKKTHGNGNKACRTNMPIPDCSGIPVRDPEIWQSIKELLQGAKDVSQGRDSGLCAYSGGSDSCCTTFGE
jgi:RNA polymerase sigma factor (sigma-70 family)